MICLLKDRFLNSLMQGGQIMNKKIRIIRVLAVLVIIPMFLSVLSSCENQIHYVSSDEQLKLGEEINPQIEACTGNGLTYDEVCEKLNEFNKIAEKYGQKTKDHESVQLGAREPEEYDKSDDARYDINLLSMQDGIYAGIEIVQVKPSPKSSDTDTEEEQIEETEEITTETEPEGMTVDDYLEWMDGWWKLEGKTKAHYLLGNLKANESLCEVEYSIDDETGGLRVVMPGETTYEYVYVYIDEDHLQYIDRTFGHEHFYERTDPPEEST